MLFTTLFSLIALAALGQSVPTPAPVEVDDRLPKSKYYCVEKYSGTLTGPGIGGGKRFPFTRSGSLVTYSGTHPENNILRVEFEACTNATTGKFLKDGTDWVGRLRLVGTTSCIDLSTKTKGGIWLPKIAACNAKKLTIGQTWRYDTRDIALFWGGWFYFGHPANNDGDDVCRGGYKHNAKGTPIVTSKNQLQVECAGEDLSKVQYWELV